MSYTIFYEYEIRNFTKEGVTKIRISYAWKIPILTYSPNLKIRMSFAFLGFPVSRVYAGCPNKHGNSVKNSISSLLWISIVISDFKRHNIIMSDRVHFMKTVNNCEHSFLSRYHFTKSKNYLKRQYRIRHWIPMFIGTPCK